MPNRIIRETACTSLTLATLSAEAERMWWRLLTYADDWGRFESDARICKGRCFPVHDDIRSTDVQGWLNELQRMGFIEYYEHAGRRYGTILHFTRWNRTRAKQSKHPPPPDNICQRVLADENMCKHMSDYTESESESESESECRRSRLSEKKTVSKPTQPPSLAVEAGVALARAVVQRHAGHTQASREAAFSAKAAGAIDKLNRLDGASWDRISAVIKWLPTSPVTGDNFSWGDVVQSGTKLRKHFDKLEGAMRRASQPRRRPGEVAPRQDADF